MHLGYFRNVGAVLVDSDHTTITTNGKYRMMPEIQYVGAKMKGRRMDQINRNTAIKMPINVQIK